MEPPAPASTSPPPGIGRPRHGARAELTLALLPTIAVLVVFGAVERFAHHRLLFASLASSAFLIYLDPHHPTNRVRTIVAAQLGAAALGVGALTAVGAGYAAAALAMIGAIFLMVVFDDVHPPAVSTAVAFAFQPGTPRGVALFAGAVGLLGGLVFLQRAAVNFATRAGETERKPGEQT